MALHQRYLFHRKTLLCVYEPFHVPGDCLHGPFNYGRRVCTAVNHAINPRANQRDSGDPSATPLTDPALLGTWYLKAMTGPGGSSPVQTISPQMDATFSGQGDISGFAGCNHYSGQYILTGEALPNGWGISVGPVLSTLMYCAGTSDIEARFLSSLQNATSYSVTGDTLTITDHHGGALVFQRTAYGPTAVPRGL